jgi:hypothetical protein
LLEPLDPLKTPGETALSLLASRLEVELSTPHTHDRTGTPKITSKQHRSHTPTRVSSTRGRALDTTTTRTTEQGPKDHQHITRQLRRQYAAAPAGILSAKGLTTLMLRPAERVTRTGSCCAPHGFRCVARSCRRLRRVRYRYRCLGAVASSPARLSAWSAYPYSGDTYNIRRAALPKRRRRRRRWPRCYR